MAVVVAARSVAAGAAEGLRQAAAAAAAEESPQAAAAGQVARAKVARGLLRIRQVCRRVASTVGKSRRQVGLQTWAARAERSPARSVVHRVSLPDPKDPVVVRVEPSPCDWVDSAREVGQDRPILPRWLPALWSEGWSEEPREGSLLGS